MGQKRKFQWGAHLDARGMLPDSESKPAAKPKKQAKPKGTVSANTLTKAIINYLAIKGWKSFRNNNGGVWDQAKQTFRKNPSALLGVPDILGFCRKTGLILAVEVKAGNDKLSAHQSHFLQEVRESGGFACEAREIGQFMNDFENYLLLLQKNGD